MAKLYETIDELIKKEKKKAAEYCFDAAWLEWVYSAVAEAEGDLHKACLSIELMEPSYFTDEGPVQWDMYMKLMKGSATSLADYSADRMTNFYYTLKMAIAFLSPERIGMKREEVSPDVLYSRVGPREGRIEVYRKSTCFSELYQIYGPALEDAKNTIDEDVVASLEGAMDEFAKRSSTLGNYCCIPKRWRDIDSLNISKANHLFLSDTSEKDVYLLNDQFALFLAWINEEQSKASREENAIVRRWKRKMLIGCCSKNYRDAFRCYKRAFAEKDPEEQIRVFAEYVGHVNAAIKDRSVAIVKKLEPNRK